MYTHEFNTFVFNSHQQRSVLPDNVIHRCTDVHQFETMGTNMYTDLCHVQELNDNCATMSR